VFIELTVPREERCDEAYKRKAAKYTQLTEDCRKKGWTAWLFPEEIGTRDFPAMSMWKNLTELGITGQQRKQAIRSVSSAAVGCGSEDMKGAGANCQLTVVGPTVAPPY